MMSLWWNPQVSYPVIEKILPTLYTNFGAKLHFSSHPFIGSRINTRCRVWIGSDLGDLLLPGSEVVVETFKTQDWYYRDIQVHFIRQNGIMIGPFYGWRRMFKECRETGRKKSKGQNLRGGKSHTWCNELGKMPSFRCFSRQQSTVGQNNRLKYWATCSSIRSFARTTHWFPCSALLASLARAASLSRSASLTRSLACSLRSLAHFARLLTSLARSLRSLPHSWKSEWLDGYSFCVFFCTGPQCDVFLASRARKVDAFGTAEPFVKRVTWLQIGGTTSNKTRPYTRLPLSRAVG